ncbi:GNAT family N-acetyltransferase [Neobacillus sp. OS1-33]|uniref:GNAT family N-acetyltransferase n=1 Tax=Neobacillus sp. OS1-33 TaxID=3070683 RepID=UPI0027E08196|nr:GNAT family N-acetyltransferase [Neobacillus sp. OS1-33]WML26892.1 GNAT family N-acetyltransferase [Neobacillus sp. OS1-33]
MEVSIKKTKLDEIEDLLAIQKDVFAEDYALYEDHDSTPVNETTKKLIENIERFFHFTIWLDNDIIGAIDIRLLDDKRLRLSKLFLRNEYQNKGLGSKIIQLMESEFSLIKDWSLYTPYLNKRNHHFYEKLGYKKIGEVQVTEKLQLFKYEKIL